MLRKDPFRSRSPALPWACLRPPRSPTCWPTSRRRASWSSAPRPITARSASSSRRARSSASSPTSPPTSPSGSGVKLELVPVVASNRMQFLQQGKIDLMIATMSDTPERRKIVDIVDPNYYGSGTNVLAPKTAKLTDWDQLKGKKVCLIQGAFYNKELQEKYGVEGVAFPGTAEAYAALQTATAWPSRTTTRRSSARCSSPTGAPTRCRWTRSSSCPGASPSSRATRAVPTSCEDHRRLAQERHDPGAREEVGDQAHQVRPDMRQAKVVALNVSRGRPDAARPGCPPSRPRGRWSPSGIGSGR